MRIETGQVADIREDAIPVAVDALAGQPGHAAGVTR